MSREFNKTYALNMKEIWFGIAYGQISPIFDRVISTSEYMSNISWSISDGKLHIFQKEIVYSIALLNSDFQSSMRENCAKFVEIK